MVLSLEDPLLSTREVLEMEIVGMSVEEMRALSERAGARGGGKGLRGGGGRGAVVSVGARVGSASGRPPRHPRGDSRVL